jgi:hypothetical protein
MPLRRLWQFVWSGEYRVLCRQVRYGRSAAPNSEGSADCVLAFAFGHLDGSPGVSNVELACFARERFPHLPAILQEEVAEVYEALAPGHRMFRIDRHREAGKYLDTREVADQARLLMARQGWQVAVLVAQAHHVPRAFRVCTRLGIRAVVPAGLECVPLCPASSQSWTRSAAAWYRRERLVLLHHAWKGWL